jgi:hypothetical protein
MATLHAGYPRPAGRSSPKTALLGSCSFSWWQAPLQFLKPVLHRRAEFYYQQLDALRSLRQQVRRELLSESQKHPAWKLLCQIQSIGPIRRRC